MTAGGVLVACDLDTTLVYSARSLADLPRQARAYLDRIEELVGVPVRYVSVGTRRDQIIDVGS